MPLRAGSREWEKAEDHACNHYKEELKEEAGKTLRQETSEPIHKIKGGYVYDPENLSNGRSGIK